MAKEFAELQIVINAKYTKQDAEEAERNVLGVFDVLKRINDRLKDSPSSPMPS